MNNYKKSYSQSGEDIIVDFLFNAMLNINEVVYLDIGSNDPVDLNNTYHFYEMGSRGVCVDPNPLFKDMYRSMRPGDVHVVAGIGPKKDKAKFYEIDPNTLSTFSEEAMKQYVNEDGHKLIKSYKVPVLPLNQLLARYFKNKIMPNFLNLDIEGWDYEVIANIDFKDWRPAVICVETITYSTSKEQEKIKPLMQLFENRGYFSYADTFINTIFVDKEVWAKRR